MYQPNYQLTNKLVNDLIRLEVDRNTVETADLNPQNVQSLFLKAKGVNMFHMAHIIGVDLTLKDAEKAADGKKVSTQDARGTVLNNYRNALEYIRSNIAGTHYDLDLNVLLHINKILLTDWKEPWEVKYRASDEEHDATLDNWLHLKDLKISPSQIQHEVLALIDWFKNSEGQVNDVLRIGVLTARLIRLAPFAVLNKLSIIAIVDFLFYKAGYLEKSFIAVTRNFDLYEQEYLEALSYSAENDDNLTIWLERLVNNLATDTKEIKVTVAKQAEAIAKSSQKPFLDLNKRQLKILRYLQTIPTVKREDYVQMMDVSTMTAFRDLDGLVKKKLVKIEGKGRATRYMLSNR